MPVRLLADDPHDELLRARVHPANWTNPSPRSRYDLVVLGGGTAGLVSAAGAAGLGANVALIERDLLGGDCLNVGCVPSKALLRAARAIAEVRDAGRFGIHVPTGVVVDFPLMMERMRRLRASLASHDSAERFRGLGVDVFLGAGQFTEPDSIEVAGATLRFRKAILATGARPADPPIPGLADAGFLTNESIFALTELPRCLAILGAGPIGCELAQAFARFGSTVTLLGSDPQLLPREERVASEQLIAVFRREGVILELGAKVEGVESRGADKVLHWSRGGERGATTADTLLVAAGRAPNVEGLGLEAAGIALDPHLGITADDYLRTTNRRVFAAGDVCSRFKFTHAADALARIAVRNALVLGRAKASALTIPWCTYTDPEIARVGLSEREAIERNIPHRVFEQSFATVDRAVLDGEEEGFVRVIAAKRGDRILGATIVARHAGEMIGEVTLAMTAGLGLKALANTVHPYPTQAEALKKIGDAYQRSRLTPWVKWLLGKWLGGGR